MVCCKALGLAHCHAHSLFAKNNNNKKKVVWALEVSQGYFSASFAMSQPFSYFLNLTNEGQGENWGHLL